VAALLVVCSCSQPASPSATSRVGFLSGRNRRNNPECFGPQEPGAVVGVDEEGSQARKTREHQEGVAEGCGGEVGSQDVGHLRCQEQRWEGGGEEAGLQAAQGR
jgi:hypothetical protein